MQIHHKITITLLAVSLQSLLTAHCETITVPVGSSGADIQTALNDVETAGGGIVIVEADNYALTSTLKVPMGVTLQGEGLTTVLNGTALSGAVVENKYQNNTQLNWSVRDLTLTPNGNEAGVRSVGASVNSRPSGLLLENVQVVGGDEAFRCLRSANTRVKNLRTSLSDVGVLQTDCADSDYSDVSIQLGSDWGFHFQQVNPLQYNEGTRCVNCTTNGQGGGVWIEGADYVKISNSSFTTAPTLGPLKISDQAFHWGIDNSELATAGTGTPSYPGIIVDPGSDYGSLTDSTLLLNSYGAIIRSSDTVIAGNVFSNNNNVDLISGGDRNALNDNLLTSPLSINTSGFSALIEIGAQYNLIRDNVFALFFSDSGTGTNAGLTGQNLCTNTGTAC